jgi:hypothetical protein
MTMNNTDTRQPQTPAAKRVYQAPRLTVHGSLVELTAAHGLLDILATSALAAQH